MPGECLPHGIDAEGGASQSQSRISVNRIKPCTMPNRNYSFDNLGNSLITESNRSFRGCWCIIFCVFISIFVFNLDFACFYDRIWCPLNTEEETHKVFIIVIFSYRKFHRDTKRFLDECRHQQEKARAIKEWARERGWTIAEETMAKTEQTWVSSEETIIQIEQNFIQIEQNLVKIEQYRKQRRMYYSLGLGFIVGGVLNLYLS
ncbi:hypothetical protein MIMGU_mgv11b011700mg [Erythranthe guttata]|uniref:Uncharacterized protein n=1 Tax=Erythranthe guttata TaxID=4155 RepID=A0A022RGB0_ERYGU|nr:hypothetical protein MIMGU_mgv11b011700mg [Erythranthe guttata]